MLIILVLKWRQKDYYGFKANFVSTVSLNLANILKKKSLRALLELERWFSHYEHSLFFQGPKEGPITHGRCLTTACNSG